jgi:hypothetical protein
VPGLTTRYDRELADLRRWLGEVNHVAQHVLERQHALEERLEGLGEQLDEAINVGRSAAALGRRLTRADQERQAELEDLREAMVAFAGTGAGSPIVRRPVVGTTSPRVAGSVQLGASSAVPEGTTCIDTFDRPHVDVVASAHRLPADAHTLTRLVLHRFLERFSERRLRDELLPYWVGLLAPGAEVEVRTVDLDTTLTAWRAGAIGYDDVRCAVVGDDPVVAPHRSAFGREALLRLLAAAGVERLEVTAIDATDDDPALLRLTGVAPGA